MHTFFREEKRSHPLTAVDARIKLLCAAAVLSMVLTCHGVFFPSSSPCSAFRPARLCIYR